MCSNLLGKPLDNHTLALGQLLATAVDIKDVAHLIQHLAVAVDPVEVVLGDVDLRAARSHQPPAEFLLCRGCLDPG